MESKEILNILKKFEETDTYKKIFINGKWGIGKSYYINKYTKNKENTVYISLFGKDKIENIQNEISDEIYKKIESKKKLIKKMSVWARKFNGVITIHGISVNTPDIITKSFLEEYRTILEEEKNLLIIIDDLERKSPKISMEDILGIIEQLSLFKKIKIVLVGDETQINKDDIDVWNSFKEKVIEKEYYITNYSKDAVNSLIKSRLKGYITDNDLNEFIEIFLKRLNVSNLRTINKGVDLFLEIYDTYITEKNININNILLITCMAVVIEKTEKIFEPLEKNNTYENKLDQDIEIRIQRHYFNLSSITMKELFLINYVLKIYDGEIEQNLINTMNSEIKAYVDRKEEKELFLLSEEEIIAKIHEKYNLIISNEYIYVDLNEFVDDIYNILYWNEQFELNLNESLLNDNFKRILFLYYYNEDKSLYDNTVEDVTFKCEKNKKLREFINDYNKEVNEKYYFMKMNNVVEEYSNKRFDVFKIKWIDNAFIQTDKGVQIEKFILKARENNYFISDLSGEISDKEWKWNHYIWNVFYKYMPQEYKKELNDYINKFKGVKKIQDIRINALQSYKPLVNGKYE